MSGADELARVGAERDLYRRLLDLGGQRELEPFLVEVLALVVEAARAHKGYIELLEDPEVAESPRWTMAYGASDEEVAAYRETLSSGIISEALARGQTISSAAAVADPRFMDRTSVLNHGIRAVLCVPIGADPALGVLYLQGRDGTGAFHDDDRERAELLARHMAPFADRLLARQRQRSESDPTATWRRQLDLRGFVGRSRVLAEVFRKLSIAAPARAPVLLTGPTGSGKSLLAHIIHENGPRREGPFVELNCGAIPEGLVESELFGALKGSFSGATRRIVGKIEAAHKGTLFLDEVGELPQPVQVKLLTLLQSGSFYQVGSAAPSSADLRVLAATNADLEVAVAERRFREDLFHRLNVVRIDLPSLDQRRDDIVPLALHLCRVSALRNGLPELPLDPEARRALRDAEWPGNVRELANRLEWAVLQAAADGSSTLGTRHLSPHAASDHPAPPRTWQGFTRHHQRQLLVETLEECGWNRSEAARRMEISRPYLYDLMRSFDLSAPG